jgi:hypothetical protein
MTTRTRFAVIAGLRRLARGKGTPDNVRWKAIQKLMELDVSTDCSKNVTSKPAANVKPSRLSELLELARKDAEQGSPGAVAPGPQE